jgi:hypothetical protein
MKHKEVIVGTLIGLGALFGLGLIYKYYKKKPKSYEEKKEKVSEEKLESEQKIIQDDFTVKSDDHEAISKVMHLIMRKYKNLSYDKELLQKYENLPNFDSDLLVKMVSSTGEDCFIKHLNQRLTSGIFNGEVKYEDLVFLILVDSKNPEMESIYYHYFKMCIPIFLEEIKTKKITGLISYALGCVMILKNKEYSTFAFEFVYKFVMENMDRMRLDEKVWGMFSLLTKQSEGKKRNDLVQAILDQGFPFDSSFVNFIIHDSELLNDDHLLQVISFIVDNKEFIEDDEANIEILFRIHSKIDITSQLKKLFKTLYLFKTMYLPKYCSLLVPETFEDATLMIPNIKKLLPSFVEMEDKSDNQMELFKINQIIGEKLSSTIFSLVDENTDMKPTVDFGMFLLKFLKDGNLEKSLKICFMNQVNIYVLSFFELEKLDQINKMIQVAVRELLDSDPQEEFRFIYLDTIISIFQNIGPVKISMTREEVKNYLLMTIKLMKDSSDEEKRRVNLLPGLFDLISIEKSIIDDLMKEIGEILNICIPTMGSIGDDSIDTTWTISSLAGTLKNRLWPWKETIFRQCHRVLKKIKLEWVETLTNALTTIYFLLNFFEKKMENLLSTPGFLDLILQFSMVSCFFFSF